MIAIKVECMKHMPSDCDFCYWFGTRPHPYKGWTDICELMGHCMDDDQPEEWIYSGDGRPKACPLVEVADHKNKNCLENPNNYEPKICDTCRYYNSSIPCGSTPSACKEADKFAKEFVDGLKKLKSKDEPQIATVIGCSNCVARFWCTDRDTPHAVHCHNYDKSKDEQNEKE